jgi:phosphate transport system permease protein
MLIKTPKGGYYLGKEGGILNAILGSIVLGIGATLLALTISLPLAFYLNLYVRKNSQLALLVRFFFDVLWGIPSIVYGAFGFTVMIFFGLQASLLAGVITVALLILPLMARSMDEVLKMIPFELKEASFALGATKLETAIKVIFRQALPGILTAILIAFGRGIGDAASVLFTASFTDSLPYSLFKPVATLPLAIFFQLGTPFPEVQERGYASALVLTAIILSISIISRWLSKRFTRHIVK